jgi:formylmethanofuran dehydrogenase subunit E
MKAISSLPGTEADDEDESECERCAEVMPTKHLVTYRGYELCIDCVIELRGEGE